LEVSSEVIVRLAVKLNPPTVNVFGTELVLLHDPIKVISEVPVVTIVGSIAKLVVLVATPYGVVTSTVPEVAAGTTAVIEVSLSTVKELTAVPPIVIPEVPKKEVPVIVIVVPVGPEAGVKEVIVGVAGGFPKFD
jgi:hypothetical protein